MPASPVEVTRLLKAWSAGERAALDQLVPLVYDELHRLARHYLRREQSDHSLQTTAVVNEAYLRLVNVRNVAWEDRAHFFGIAARLIRQILVDHARQRGSHKRGGGHTRVELEESAVVAPGKDDELLALNEALEGLSQLDERKCQVVELRYFGGLTVEETALVLNVSPDTVRRDWRLARSWLRKRLREESENGP